MRAIIELKESFDQPVQEVRQALDVCDSDCPNLHFTKLVTKIVVDHEIDPSVSSDDGECLNVYKKEIGVDRQGHPLVCSSDVSVMEGVAVKCIYSELLQRITHYRLNYCVLCIVL